MLPRRDSRSILKQPNATMPHAHSSAAFYSSATYAPSNPVARHPPLAPHKPKLASLRVSFEAKVDTAWGDSVVVVGDKLGNWDPTQGGLALHTDAATYPIWRASTELPPVSCEYKLIILRAERDGKREIVWEPIDGNRRLSFDGQRGVQLRVSAAWGGKGSQEWEAAAAPSMLASQKPPVHFEVGSTPTTAQALAPTELEIQKAAELVRALPPRSPAPNRGPRMPPRRPVRATCGGF